MWRPCNPFALWQAIRVRPVTSAPPAPPFRSREREEVLLEKVRKAFGLKCIIKICMNDKVLEGAQRLLENADVIKSNVDLRGASIALDDCYEVGAPPPRVACVLLPAAPPLRLLRHCGFPAGAGVCGAARPGPPGPCPPPPSPITRAPPLPFPVRDLCRCGTLASSPCPTTSRSANSRPRSGFCSRASDPWPRSRPPPWRQRVAGRGRPMAGCSWPSACGRRQQGRGQRRARASGPA